MIQNIKRIKKTEQNSINSIVLKRDHSIKLHNLDKHYDISDETYYNRPFSFRETYRTGKPK